MIIKVMPEHSSTGLWDSETSIMLDDLKLPESLDHELKEWIKFYEQSFESDWVTFKPNRTGRLNTWGLDLAHKVKKQFPDNAVEYLGEDEKGVHDLKEIKAWQ